MLQTAGNHLWGVERVRKGAEETRVEACSVETWEAQASSKSRPCGPVGAVYHKDPAEDRAEYLKTTTF